MCISGALPGFPQLVKLDTVTKEEKTWGDGVPTASEPVFVPNPSGTEEDDGIHQLLLCLPFMYRVSLLIITSLHTKSAPCGLVGGEVVNKGLC